MRVCYQHTPLAKIYRYDKLLGWINKENTSGVFYSRLGTAKFHFNNLGLRNKKIETKKPEGLIRILALGDSFTAGLEVNDDQAFCAILEKSLNATEKGNLQYQVLNAAVRGWSTDQEYLCLKQLMPLLQPDIVIFQVSNTDFTEISTTLVNKRMYYKPRFILNKNNGLTIIGTPTPKIKRGFFYYLNHMSALFHFLVNKWDFVKKQARFLKERVYISEPASISHDNSIILFLRLIKESERLTMENGGKMMLLFIGNPASYKINAQQAKDLFHSPGGKIPNKLNNTSILWFYFDPAKHYIIPSDGHLNKEGHQAVAMLILDKLNEAGYLRSEDTH